MPKIEALNEINANSKPLSVMQLPKNAMMAKKRSIRKTTPLIPQPRFSADVEYQLRPFDPTKIRECSTIVACGGRRTGKSFLVRDLVYHIRRMFYDCYVYTGSRDTDHPWEEITPPKYIQTVKGEFPNDDLQSILDLQKVRMQIAEKHGIKTPSTLLLFEDLEFLLKPMWKYQSIREVFLNGRWSQVFAIAAVQYLNRIELSVRSMMDYAFFMMENNYSVRERIFKQFCGILPNMRDFETVFMRCTEDHKCLAVDCRSTSYKVNEVLFWYKAKDCGKFRVGVPAVWDHRVDERNAHALLDRNTVQSAIAQQRETTTKTSARKGKGKGKNTSIGVQLME